MVDGDASETDSKSRPLRRVHLPMLRPDDLKRHLRSEGQYRAGYSAQSCAESWFTAKDLPVSIRTVLGQAPEWHGAVMLDAYLERAVDLEDGVRGASMTDAMAICRMAGGGLGVVAVEAKVREDFGPTVGQWLGDNPPHKRKRLDALCALLGIDGANIARLRYQLFHRTASAVLEARRYEARHAAMVVQSFCPDASHFDDFARFAAAAGFGAVAVGAIGGARECGGVKLRIGWAGK